MNWENVTIDTWEKEETFAPTKLEQDYLVCECFCVSVADIREVCKDEVDLELLKNEYSFGQGCQSCLKNRDHWCHLIF